ncbi:MAG: hypothetical protein JWO95_1521, partial [Verrucomicrobiales bacterium]|nr:hypothetical protein [Verrucomicrobiales bacterium]
EKSLDQIEVFVRFGELAAGIAEHVFQVELRARFTHVDSEGGAILAAGQSKNVPDWPARINLGAAHVCQFAAISRLPEMPRLLIQGCFA